MPIDAYPQQPSEADTTAFRDLMRQRAPQAEPDLPFRWLRQDSEPDERCDHLIAANIRDPSVHCNACDAVVHNAWVDGVQARLFEAVEAAVEGRTTVWRVWPAADGQEVVDEAAAEFGFTPWTVRRYDYDPALDGVVTGAEREALDAALWAPDGAPGCDDTHGACSIATGHVDASGAPIRRPKPWVGESVDAMASFNNATFEHLQAAVGLSIGTGALLDMDAASDLPGFLKLTDTQARDLAWDTLAPTIDRPASDTGVFRGEVFAMLDLMRADPIRRTDA